MEGCDILRSGGWPTWSDPERRRGGAEGAESWPGSHISRCTNRGRVGNPYHTSTVRRSCASTFFANWWRRCFFVGGLPAHGWGFGYGPVAQRISSVRQGRTKKEPLTGEPGRR